MGVSTNLLTKVLIGTGIAASVSVGGFALYKQLKPEAIKENQDDYEETEQEPINTTQFIKRYVDKTSKTGWELVKDKNSHALSLTFDLKDGNNSRTCKIIAHSESKIKEINKKLEDRFGSKNLTEDNKRQRRGFLTRCLNVEKSGLLMLHEDIRMFLDFSQEELNSQELNLINQNGWNIKNPAIKSEASSNIVEMVIEVNSPEDSKKISVNFCKIISSKKKTGEETINESQIQNIKATIENKLNKDPNKATNRKNFLLSCKRSIDNEIHSSLMDEKSNNSYQIENLDKIFDGTFDQE